MRILTGKRILIISTERWDHHFLSKHNLAIALCKLNNQVFFLNPPSTKDECVAEPGHPGLFLLTYKRVLRGIHFLPRRVAKWISRMEAVHIQNQAGGNFDVVWTFDPFRFEDIHVFRARWSIYHAADVHLAKHEGRLADSVQIIVGPSVQLLSRFDPSKSICIGHMIDSQTVKQEPLVTVGLSARIQIGYVGDLLSRFLDYPLLLDTVTQNPQCDFTFMGENKGLQEDAYWRQLMKLDNVYLAGPVSHEQLAARLAGFDMFWCCYETEKYFQEASNSHKILEYLATGKPVVSTRIAYYLDKDEILLMPRINAELPTLVKKIAASLQQHTDHVSVSRRLKFVNEHTFGNALVRIDNFLSARS